MMVGSTAGLSAVPLICIALSSSRSSCWLFDRHTFNHEPSDFHVACGLMWPLSVGHTMDMTEHTRILLIITAFARNIVKDIVIHPINRALDFQQVIDIHDRCLVVLVHIPIFAGST